MFTLNEIILIILIHFLADFGLQTHEQATNKSTSNRFLFYHVGVYSLVWLILLYPTMSYNSLIFATITFIAHYITDYTTSRVGKPFWTKGDYHNGFIVVGFDQILHYLQLFITYLYLR